MTIFWFISPALCLVIRWYLVHENRLRAAKLAEDSDEGEANAIDTGDGLMKLLDADMDQTDRENLKFVYPL